MGKKKSKTDIFLPYLSSSVFLFTGQKSSKEVVQSQDEEKWKKCPFVIWDRNPSFPPLSDALGIGTYRVDEEKVVFAFCVTFSKMYQCIIVKLFGV